MPTLPPFYAGPWSMFPYTLLRVMDPSCALLLGVLIVEKEKHDRDDFPTADWVPHDDAGTRSRFGWSRRYFDAKFATCVSAGYVEKRTVGAGTECRLDLGRIQSLVG